MSVGFLAATGSIFISQKLFSARGEQNSQRDFRQVDIGPFSLEARFSKSGSIYAGEIEVDTAAIVSMQPLDCEAGEAMVAAITRDTVLTELPYYNHVVRPVSRSNDESRA